MLLVNTLNNSLENSNHIVNSFDQNEEVILYYQGGLSNQFIIQTGTEIKTKLQAQRPQGQKVYNIFMELAQNILLYSQEHNLENGEIISQVGTFALKEKKSHFNMVFGNLIRKQDELHLSNRIQKFNNFSNQELRKHRVAISKKEGKTAGLGLIKVLLTSGLELKPTFTNVNKDYTYYIIQVIINKNQNGKLRN